MESIQTIGRREMINSEIMSEIRREAITEELQTALFRELRQIA
jgi:hypothetical protein